MGQFIEIEKALPPNVRWGLPASAMCLVHEAHRRAEGQPFYGWFGGAATGL